MSRRVNMVCSLSLPVPFDTEGRVSGTAAALSPNYRILLIPRPVEVFYRADL